MFSATPFIWLDHLERRYDGPIPEAKPVPASARARLFQRLASETRGLIAARRTLRTARAAIGDERLHRLGRDLGLYRAEGIAWVHHIRTQRRHP
ncbi:MAG TPA: hypothetical protein VK196_05415 [Magnetospirillum sp.]|nr:hypothetical protein [Magnetospirillum sp.]